jgi:hypothetical protein
MSDAIRYFPYIYMALRVKYLNGRSSGCPTRGTLEPRGVLKALLYLGRMASKY